MKKIITLSCLVLLCSFAGMAQKFALIDMEYILKNIPAYEMTNEQLSQVSKKWQNEVEAIQQEAQNMYKNYQSDLVFLSRFLYNSPSGPKYLRFRSCASCSFFTISSSRFVFISAERNTRSL